LPYKKKYNDNNLLKHLAVLYLSDITDQPTVLIASYLLLKRANIVKEKYKFIRNLFSINYSDLQTNKLLVDQNINENAFKAK
jgi:hypothetical protein